MQVERFELSQSWFARLSIIVLFIIVLTVIVHQVEGSLFYWAFAFWLISFIWYVIEISQAKRLTSLLFLKQAEGETLSLCYQGQWHDEVKVVKYVCFLGLGYLCFVIKDRKRPVNVWILQDQFKNTHQRQLFFSKMMRFYQQYA